jgi:RNase P subunit RPR2
MERHDIRAEHGRFAGRFISRKRKLWRENVLAAKRKKEPTVHSDFTHVGRRVVELGFLAEELWCNQCNVPLSLRNTEAELTKGLASVLDIRCLRCNVLKKVSTGKSNCAIFNYYFKKSFKIQ